MVECCGRVERDQAAAMIAAAERYRAHERYGFGWTDPRGLYQSEIVRCDDVEQVTRDYDQFITNFMGMVIIMVPVYLIAYWFWF